MTLHGNVSILDPYAHTYEDILKILTFDFHIEHTRTETEKVMIDETFCALVVIGEKVLEENTFRKTLMKIDEIRRIIR